MRNMRNMKRKMAAFLAAASAAVTLWPVSAGKAVSAAVTGMLAIISAAARNAAIFRFIFLMFLMKLPPPSFEGFV